MRFSILHPTSLVILGPTASGKTTLAVDLARELDFDILSVDSRQLYRGLDIGTGKDLSEYGQGPSRVPTHMLDVVDVGEEFNLFRFVKEAHRVQQDLLQRGKKCIFCGGTGLYLDALLRDFDLQEIPVNEALRKRLQSMSLQDLRAELKRVNPNLHNTTDLENPHRLSRAIEIASSGQQLRQDDPVVLPCPVLGLEWPLEDLHQRITQRLHERIDEGMLQEVQGLLDADVDPARLLGLGLEYRFCTEFLQGQMTRDEFVHGLRKAIVRFAKQQRSWFRRMERMGIQILWIQMEKGDAKQQALAHLHAWNQGK
jgi:tRNA dimethylallyltransferase